jgi:uncharacterized protein (TIGR02996 family)
MTDRERELREAIEAAPDDDAPRLILADWLGEQGDPLGELIAVQCALARAPGAGPDALRAREKEIRAGPAEDWARRFVPWASDVMWSRGLPSDLGVASRKDAFERAPLVLSLPRPWPRLRTEREGWFVVAPGGAHIVGVVHSTIQAEIFGGGPSPVDDSSSTSVGLDVYDARTGKSIDSAAYGGVIDYIRFEDASTFVIVWVRDWDEKEAHTLRRSLVR